MGILAVVELPMVTGMPNDTVTNTFVFGGASDQSTAPTIQAIYDKIVAFYTAAMPAGSPGPMGTYLSSVLKRTAGPRIKLYDISGQKLELNPATGRPYPHGSPFLDSEFTLGAAGAAQDLPEEVACCVTLEAEGRADQLVETVDGVDLGTKPDRPRQRYTGRFFLGPFKAAGDIYGGGAGAITRVGANFMTNLCQHYINTIGAVNAVAGVGIVWPGVWSRANGEIREIGSVSVDNAWDTIRKRGPKATTRTRVTRTNAAGVELAA